MGQSGKSWDLCDDCLDPLAHDLLSIADRFHRFFDVAEADRPGGKCRQTEPPRAFDVEALYRQYGLDLAIAWLKFNKSVEYADDFQRTLLDAKERFSALEFKACQIINGDEGKEPTIMVRYPIQRLENLHLEKLREAFPDHESYPDREELPDDLRAFEAEILDEYEAAGRQIREAGSYLRRVSALVQSKMKKADVGEAAQGDDEAKTRRRRGRKKADHATIQREAEIAANWTRAREGGAYKPEWAKDNGMTEPELDAILDRVYKRKKRSDK